MAIRIKILAVSGFLTLAFAMAGLGSGGGWYVRILAGAGIASRVRAETTGAAPELPRVYLDTTYVAPTGKTIAVSAGGDFQAALDQAQPGDIITLQAGATYVGTFTLPVKTGANWIVIRSSAPESALPPPGTRITPAYAGVLPKIVTSNVEAALDTADGAHHYRFIGVEFTATPSAPFTYNMINLGGEQSTLAQTPHHLILDRVYIHGRPDFTLRRGIALNSASTAIIDSYISDCHEVGIDSQAIGGWNGPGPFKIVNNYLEGAGENIIFGGADPSIPNLVPSDIEFRRNYCFKPLSWRIEDPSYAGIPWGVKNLFELKNAQRVWIDGNIFEHNWTYGQNGIAILFTVRNQDGTAPWSVVQDVTFTNNIVRRTASGVNILGDDNNNVSLRTRRIRVANNLFDEVDGQRWSGGGIVFQIVRGPQDITIENNTTFQDGSIIAVDDIASPGLIFRNNITPHNEYGIKGDNRESGNDTITTYFADSIFRKNALIGAQSKDYPADNFFPVSFAQVGFIDFAAGNYRLASTSPYKNAGTDGKDIGCDIDTLNAAISSEGFEADISPRPNGGGTVQVSDWVQAGRFVSGVDTPAVGNEFRRADCAPRATLGDGRITVADWVQAGRYAMGLDALRQTGGPATTTSLAVSQTQDIHVEQQQSPRELRVTSQIVSRDEEYVDVPLVLMAQGGENGMTLSLTFNPAVLSYESYVLGRDIGSGPSAIVNTSRVSRGQAGFGLLLKPGESFLAGELEILVVRFKVLNQGAGATKIGIGSGPLSLGLSDAEAQTLPVRPVFGKVSFSKIPVRNTDPRN
ncbi:MAG: hypothetical protein IPJ07_12600 [Acidobacteria bacterium]|nr:hypothetical protein [Acidobacteriota bacterium]